MFLKKSPLHTFFVFFSIFLFTAPASLAQNSGGVPAGSNIQINLPIPGSCNDIVCVIDQFVNFLLLIGFPIATLFIIIGGIQIGTAGGNTERVQKGKRTITYAALGLFIIMIATSVEAFIRALL